MVSLQAKRSRSSLSELQLYLMDDADTWQQTNFLTAAGAAVLTSDDVQQHEVDEVRYYCLCVLVGWGVGWGGRVCVFGCVYVCVW